MANTFGSSELTLSATEQALGGAVDVDWLEVRTVKGADVVVVGATGIALGSDYPLVGGDMRKFGKCTLSQVFALGAHVGDKLYYCWNVVT